MPVWEGRTGHMLSGESSANDGEHDTVSLRARSNVDGSVEGTVKGVEVLEHRGRRGSCLCEDSGRGGKRRGDSEEQGRELHYSSRVGISPKVVGMSGWMDDGTLTERVAIFKLSYTGSYSGIYLFPSTQRRRKWMNASLLPADWAL
ncbi:hypothetical protein PM082_004642 [Marasmius tenuissimus]|nr:hypothetical protein PM082_004642 [Marasmius tenuissimus]